MCAACWTSTSASLGPVSPWSGQFFFSCKVWCLKFVVRLYSFPVGMSFHCLAYWSFCQVCPVQQACILCENVHPTFFLNLAPAGLLCDVTEWMRLLSQQLYSIVDCRIEYFGVGALSSSSIWPGVVFFLMAAVALLPIFKSFCDAYSLSGKTNGALTTLEYWSSPAGFWLLSDPLQEHFLLPFFHLPASENYFPPQEFAFQGNHRGPAYE